MFGKTIVVERNGLRVTTNELSRGERRILGMLQPIFLGVVLCLFVQFLVLGLLSLDGGNLLGGLGLCGLGGLILGLGSFVGERLVPRECRQEWRSENRPGPKQPQQNRPQQNSQKPGGGSGPHGQTVRFPSSGIF